jgi:uncharacterized protein (TIGR03086 family)
MHWVEDLVVVLDRQAQVGGSVLVSQLALPSMCPGWTVGDVLSHSIGVSIKFADFAAGMTDRPRSPRGDLFGDDHRAALSEAAERARASWATADMTRACVLPFGTFTAEEAAGINLSDALAHTWDVTRALGMPVGVEDRVWESALSAARRVAGPNRDPAHYGPQRPVDRSDPPMRRFLCFLGRDDRACGG